MSEDPGEESRNQERNRWILSLVITTIGLAIFGLLLAMFSQSRVFSFDKATATFLVREDFTGDAVGDLIGQGVGAAFSLLFMAGGGSFMLTEGERKLGLVMWLSSFVLLYFVATHVRDTLTLSELRLDEKNQMALCSGYRLGQRAWTEALPFSQLQTASFPVGQGLRYGVTITAKQGAFCSLHNRTLSSDEAKQLSRWLESATGGPGKNTVQVVR